jgi:hypothetical protein
MSVQKGKVSNTIISITKELLWINDEYNGDLLYFLTKNESSFNDNETNNENIDSYTKNNENKERESYTKKGRKNNSVLFKDTSN